MHVVKKECNGFHFSNDGGFTMIVMRNRVMEL